MLFSLRWTIWSWFHPTLEALFARNISFSLRWRMFLLLQPTAIMTNSITCIPWLFSRAFTTEYITVDTGRTFRIIVFNGQGKSNDKRNVKLRPLHLNVHGGAFMGGTPEGDAAFCDLLARTTGALVISATYRFAPAHCFPAAIDDVDAIVRFLQAHAIKRWGANPELMTVSGSSAGGNLVMAATQQLACHEPAATAFKAAVTYYGVMDLRLNPAQKPRPASVSENDPANILFPLMDSYAAPVRNDHMEDARFSPMLAKLETLPKDVLLIVPAIDIIVHEQLTFANRIRSEIEADPEGKGRDRSFEAVVYETGFHGWTYLPDRIAGPSKMEAINRGVDFLKNVYKKHGWEWIA